MADFFSRLAQRAVDGAASSRASAQTFAVLSSESPTEFSPTLDERSGLPSELEGSGHTGVGERGSWSPAPSAPAVVTGSDPLAVVRPETLPAATLPQQSNPRRVGDGQADRLPVAVGHIAPSDSVEPAVTFDAVEHHRRSRRGDTARDDSNPSISSEDAGTIASSGVGEATSEFGLPRGESTFEHARSAMARADHTSVGDGAGDRAGDAQPLVGPVTSRRAASRAPDMVAPPDSFSSSPLRSLQQLVRRAFLPAARRTDFRPVVSGVVASADAVVDGDGGGDPATNSIVPRQARHGDERQHPMSDAASDRVLDVAAPFDPGMLTEPEPTFEPGVRTDAMETAAHSVVRSISEHAPAQQSFGNDAARPEPRSASESDGAVSAAAHPTVAQRVRRIVTAVARPLRREAGLSRRAADHANGAQTVAPPRAHPPSESSPDTSPPGVSQPSVVPNTGSGSHVVERRSALTPAARAAIEAVDMLLEQATARERRIAHGPVVPGDAGIAAASSHRAHAARSSSEFHASDRSTGSDVTRGVGEPAQRIVRAQQPSAPTFSAQPSSEANPNAREDVQPVRLHQTRQAAALDATNDANHHGGTSDGVRISIGRIEVRSDEPKQPPGPRIVRGGRGPELSLHDYLKQRNRERQ